MHRRVRSKAAWGALRSLMYALSTNSPPLRKKKRSPPKGNEPRRAWSLDEPRLTSDLRIDDVHARVAHVELGPSVTNFLALRQSRACVLRPPRYLFRYRAEKTAASSKCARSMNPVEAVRDEYHGEASIALPRGLRPQRPKRVRPGCGCSSDPVARYMHADDHHVRPPGRHFDSYM